MTIGEAKNRDAVYSIQRFYRQENFIDFYK